MQNFTFGRKGLNWFLFAFILFVGSSSSYGQTSCATISPDQDYCYLETIQDLIDDGVTDSDGDTAVFETADNENDTDPIDEDELLTNGETYYVGSTSDNSCTRAPVTVVVDDTTPTPMNTVTDDRGDFTISPCESSDYTAGQLEGLFTADPGFEIQVYDSEFGTTAMADIDQLTPDASYFVGQVDNNAGDGTDCPSTRAAVGFDPIDALPPDADADQSFCDGATVADLMASPVGDNVQDIRWYRSRAANTPLDEDEELVNGEDYFAAQVVNERNSPFPPCETPRDERREVVVTLSTFDAGGDVTGDICEDDLRQRIADGEGADILFSFVDDDRDPFPSQVSFDPSLAELAQQFQEDPTQPIITDATFTTPEECTDVVNFNITINESFNAGDDNTEGNVVCRAFFSEPIATEAEVEAYLRSLFNDAEGDEIDMDGDFSDDDITTITNLINDGSEGPFTTTYTAGQGEPCEDSANFAFEVNQANDLGMQVGDGIYCQSEIDERIASTNMYEELARELFLEQLDPSVPQDGTFTNDNLAVVVSQYDRGFRTFNTTYTVGSGECSSSIRLTFSIIAESPANAGSFDNIGDVCTNDETIDLTTLANNDPDATSGGTFTGEGVTGNEFDPSIGEGTYTITYSVDDSEDCVEEGTNDSTTFTVTVEDTTTTTSITRTLCIANAQELISNPSEGIAYLNGLLTETGVDEFNLDNFSDGAIAEATALSNFIDNPSADSQTFSFEYTDPSSGSSCGDTVISIDITITDEPTANAGDDNLDNNNICPNTFSNPATETEVELYLTSLLSEDADGGGEFSNITSITNDINNGLEGPFNSTYTVDPGSSCSDSADLEFSISNSIDLGTQTGDGIYCQSEIDERIGTASPQELARQLFLEQLDPSVPTDGTFTNDNLAVIVSQYDRGFRSFSTTYTVDFGGDCTASIRLSISILEEAPANAGSFDNIEDVCTSDETIDLTTLANNNPDATSGGIFTGEGVTGNEFDPSSGEGTYTITYSVDDSEDCVEEGTNDSTTFTITVEDAPISASISRSLCVTDARDLISDPTTGLAYLQGLVEEAGIENFDVDNFSDEASAEAMSLANFIETPTSDSETFNFEYTDPSDSVCDDGIISVSITINDLQDADAGDIEDQTVCESSGMIDLTDFFTEDSVPGGTFSGIGVDENMFDSSLGVNADGYEITYTVDDSADCVAEGTSDSTTFIISVEDSFIIGEDQSRDVCQSQVDELFPSNVDVRAFYNSLLDPDVVGEGTYNPTIQSLINRYNSGEQIGEFTTVYTVTRGSCSSSVALSINIVDSIPAEIGEITDPAPICRNADDVDLLSFLPEDANPNGTFEGYEDGIFSPGMEGAGSFEITYTLTEDSPCTEGEASATFTVTVTESAYAGEDMELSVCTDEGVQNLFDFLSVDADTNGEFSLDGEVIADGMMNPADFEAGDYEVIYTVDEINDCGGDTATFDITVEEAPAAPTVEGNPFTFCATDGATAADLSATGTNLTYYSDEALSMMVAPEDVLVGGTYYVTQRNDEGACESEAAEIIVNINDADTPTISNTTQEFCEFDDATLADLTDLVNESGTITWYDSEDGDNALNSGTSLQDGVTYYATLFNIDTGCESSVRLAVTVSINDDCPITIPEGFSPNGDGLNDRFEIRNIRDKYPNFTIEIRNRFGDVVYKGNANTPDWDGYSTEGSFGSDILPVGAYFYYLRYNDGSTEPVRGTVYLSR